MQTVILFETAIYGFLVADAAAILYLIKWAKSGLTSVCWKSGRLIHDSAALLLETQPCVNPLFALVVFAIILLALAWLTVFYGSFIEPRIILTHIRKIKLTKNPKTILKAALISDMHVGPYKKDGFLNRIVKKILAQKPDIIFLAGDFIFGSAKEVKYLKPFGKLKAPLGVFAVLGNHDYGYSEPQPKNHENIESEALVIKTALENLGIKVLVNEDTVISKNGTRILLAGMDELWTNRAVLPGHLNNPLGMPIILLAHNPDIVNEAAEKGIDLVIAGHTHGGQITLPFIGPVPEIPTSLGRRFAKGLFKFGKKTQLLITSGLGEWGTRARLFVPPEIVILNIEV